MTRLRSRRIVSYSLANMAFRPEQCIVEPLPAQDDAWRVEIDELLADPAQTNLFLLALKAMQDDYPYKTGKDENWLSYYNLAGMPYSMFLVEYHD